jgi:hypothetical protein
MGVGLAEVDRFSFFSEIVLNILSFLVKKFVILVIRVNINREFGVVGYKSFLRWSLFDCILFGVTLFQSIKLLALSFTASFGLGIVFMLWNVLR